MKFREYIYFNGSWVFNTECEQPEGCSRKRMKAVFRSIVGNYIAKGYEVINLSVPGKRIYCLQKDGCLPLKVVLV